MLNGRGWMIFFLLGAAFLPYLLSAKSPIRGLLDAPLSMFGGAPEPAAPPAAKSPAAEHSAGTATAAALKPAVPGKGAAAKTDEPVLPIEQVFRWEATPAWILSTWPRVTTHLAELELQGYRVPLVTGTAETDVAGSLTYYFDATQQLRRMTFYGTTGDARNLVLFLNRAHGFGRRLTQDPGLYLYQVERDGRAISELRIRAAPVVSAGTPYSRFAVSLEISRPDD